MWEAEEFDGLNPTVYDWCRMAAYIDGEGNLNINPLPNRHGGTRYQARVLITNTNPALPVWLRDTFGGNVVLRNIANKSHKKPYVWSCTAARCAWILHNCLPWFLLKKAQAQILIELQRNIDLTHQGRHKFVPVEREVARVKLKEQLHVLNAKGAESQVVIAVQDLPFRNGKGE